MDVTRHEFTIGREWTFQSAHFLPNVSDEHKCKRMHGHTYTVAVETHGNAHATLGWVVDFGTMDVAMKPLIFRLDHRVLNEVLGLENPTAEMLALWFWNALVLDRLAHGWRPLRVRVSEGPRSWAVYEGP